MNATEITPMTREEVMAYQGRIAEQLDTVKDELLALNLGVKTTETYKRRVSLDIERRRLGRLYMSACHRLAELGAERKRNNIDETNFNQEFVFVVCERYPEPIFRELATEAGFSDARIQWIIDEVRASL